MFRNNWQAVLAFMLANDRGLMPAKHVINALPCIPVIKLASLYFHYCFLATKQGHTFRNANNLYSSCRQTFVKSPAEMNDQCSYNVRLKHKIIVFPAWGKYYSCDYSIKKSLLFLFSRQVFFWVYDTISPQNVIIPYLFILHRTNLTYQFCFISWADGWGGFFQPAGSMWQI